MSLIGRFQLMQIFWSCSLCAILLLAIPFFLEYFWLIGFSWCGCCPGALLLLAIPLFLLYLRFPLLPPIDSTGAGWIWSKKTLLCLTSNFFAQRYDPPSYVAPVLAEYGAPSSSYGAASHSFSDEYRSLKLGRAQPGLEQKLAAALSPIANRWKCLLKSHLEASLIFTVIPESHSQQTQAICDSSYLIDYNSTHQVPLSGATCIGCKFATRWHNLYQLQFWPPVGNTCTATLPRIAYWLHHLVLSWNLHHLSLICICDWGVGKNCSHIWLPSLLW